MENDLRQETEIAWQIICKMAHQALGEPNHPKHNFCRLQCNAPRLPCIVVVPNEMRGKNLVPCSSTGALMLKASRILKAFGSTFAFVTTRKPGFRNVWMMFHIHIVRISLTN